jgi:hypothetical protein
MPLYDAQCECGAVTEIVRSYADRDVPETCACGQAMKRVWLPSRVMRDIDGYQSPIDGKWVGSRSEHREHMKRHGVIELGNEKPKLGAFKASVPREMVREEIKNNVERMKAHGTWREV